LFDQTVAKTAIAATGYKGIIISVMMATMCIGCAGCARDVILKQNKGKEAVEKGVSVSKFEFGSYESLCEITVPTKNALVLVCPVWQAYVYFRKTVESFFRYTPLELNPICIALDDATSSPQFREQNWDYFYAGPSLDRALPRERICHRYFHENAGLTRSWNAGLSIARELGAQYAIAGNADILFTPGWERALIHFLNQGVRLVGPVTNAPGRTNRQRQSVRNYFPNYKVNDDREYLHKVAGYLWRNHGVETIRYMMINGFFTMSTLAHWFEGAFDPHHVFDPSKKMQGNEDELEVRWQRKHWKIGFVPGSFVFHFRAASRGQKFCHTGWMRTNDPHKPV